VILTHPKDWDFELRTIPELMTEEDWAELLGGARQCESVRELFDFVHTLSLIGLLVLYTGAAKEVANGVEVNHGVNMLGLAAMCEHVLAQQLEKL
jgi:hypothetical protein